MLMAGRTRWDELHEQFLTYHRAHPTVWTYIEAAALRKIREGRTRYGIARLVEEIRWDTGFGDRDPHLKVGNNERAFYARLFHERHPEHSRFFKLREQASRNQPATGRPRPTRFELEGE